MLRIKEATNTIIYRVEVQHPDIGSEFVNYHIVEDNDDLEYPMEYNNEVIKAIKQKLKGTIWHTMTVRATYFYDKNAYFDHIIYQGGIY